MTKFIAYYLRIKHRDLTFLCVLFTHWGGFFTYFHIYKAIIWLLSKKDENSPS